jgi:hypothetical protein
MCRSTIDLDSEVSTPPPFASSRELTNIPSQALAPLQSFTHTPPRASGLHGRRTDPQDCTSAPPEVLSPIAFSQPRRATYPQRFPHRRLCCALRVSHPLDALLPARPAELVSSRSRTWGSPFEASILTRRRTPSLTPGPSWGSNRLRGTGPPLQGFDTPREARPRCLGVSQNTLSRASLSFIPYEVSCPRRLVSWSRPTVSPHVLLRLGLHADLAAGTPGFLSPETQPFSLEIDATSLEFLTSWTFSSIWKRRRAGLSVPLRGQPLSPEVQPSSLPYRHASCRSPAREPCR